MDLTNAPSKITLPFASSGSKNTIPVASQIGILDGAASFTDGFPPLTMTNTSSGGVPPYGKDFNGVLYALSNALRWANAGGGFVYDSTFASDTNVNGYPIGARVLRADGTGYWLNLVDGNTTDPDGSSPSGWVPDYTYGIASVTMTSSNVTLTSVQYGKPIIVISGTLTANLNLIFPAIAGKWDIINQATMGSYYITVKTASGTGINIYGSASIVCNGTNIYEATGSLLKYNNLSDLQSLSTALSNLGFAQNHATSGYQKLPGGLIIQWGLGTNQSASDSPSSAQTITYYTSFPNAVFCVVCSTDYVTNANNLDAMFQVGYITTSNFKAFPQLFAGGSGQITPHWIAIGI